MISSFKVWAVYSCMLGIIVTVVSVLLHRSSSPELLLQGQWQEKEWQYEKVDKAATGLLAMVENGQIKEILAPHLKIHMAETWHFMSDGTLVLQGQGKEVNARWSIKGRGNILQLKYPDENEVENYNVSQLDENRLILNFESDLHVRGIARLVFSRINYSDNAQQVQ